jgi:hypothetical protein
MGVTTFPNGLSSFGVPVLGGGVPTSNGPYYFVNSAVGSGSAPGNNGTSPAKAFSTIQRAVNVAVTSYGAVILVAPGSYNETVTIPRPTANAGSEALVIMGLGNRGNVVIAPTAADANALVNHADDVTLMNIGMAANGAGTSLINTGARLRMQNCKLENQAGNLGICAMMTLGTTAERTAGTAGGGNDCRLYDCEIANAFNGVRVQCTSGGAVVDLMLDYCRFNNLVTNGIYEFLGSGGAAATTFRGLLVRNCTFNRLAAGTEPTAGYIVLNANNANTGMITANSFPTAIAGGKNLVSTAVIWSANYMAGGMSAAQPT